MEGPSANYQKRDEADRLCWLGRKNAQASSFRLIKVKSDAIDLFPSSQIELSQHGKPMSLKFSHLEPAG